MNPLQLHALFHSSTSTLTYIVWDEMTGDAVVLDPVLDYDPVAQLVSPASLGPLVKFVANKRLNVRWIFDTHAHADHLSGSMWLKKIWPQALWGMGAALQPVFENFRKVYAWPDSVRLEALGVDRWLHDGEEFAAGRQRWRAISTPGHTPACTTMNVGSWLFTGDALMMPDGGTGRCDFPGGSAARLYDSIWGKIYVLPDDFKIFVGHDYQPAGRRLIYQTTVGEEKVANIHLRSSTAREPFVQFREARDKTLAPPRLFDVSLDWNLGAHQIVKALN